MPRIQKQSLGRFLFVLSLVFAFCPSIRGAVFQHEIPMAHGLFDDATAINQYHDEVIQVFLDHNYEALEHEAERCRSQKLAFPCGDRYLFHFFQSFDKIPISDENRFARLEEASLGWVQKYPNSAAAWLARTHFSARRAQFESQFMFRNGADNQARGQKGWGDGLQMYKASAEKTWMADQAASVHIPQVLHEIIDVEMMEELNGVPDLSELWAKVEASPEDPYSFRQLIWKNSPYGYDAKSHGNRTKFNSFLASWSKKKGVEVYFDAASWLSRGHHQDLFIKSDIPMAKVLKGFRIEFQKTKSLALVGRMAYIACLAEDQTVAKEMFGRLGERYEIDYWGSDTLMEIDMAPYLNIAEVENAREEEDWFYATDGGKNPRGLKIWNKGLEHNLDSAEDYFSTDLSKVASALSDDALMPEQQRRERINVFACLQWGVNCTPKAKPLQDRAASLADSAQMPQYLVYMHQKELALGPNTSDPKTRIQACIAAVVRSMMQDEKLDRVLALQNNSVLWEIVRDPIVERIKYDAILQNQVDTIPDSPENPLIGPLLELASYCRTQPRSNNRLFFIRFLTKIIKQGNPKQASTAKYILMNPVIQ